MLWLWFICFHVDWCRCEISITIQGRRQLLKSGGAPSSMTDGEIVVACCAQWMSLTIMFSSTELAEKCQLILIRDALSYRLGGLCPPVLQSGGGSSPPCPPPCRHLCNYEVCNSKGKCANSTDICTLCTLIRPHNIPHQSIQPIIRQRIILYNFNRL